MSYHKPLAFRIGQKTNARRAPTPPSKLSDQELLEVVTCSPAAAKTLLDEFGNLAALAHYGSENGFGKLLGYPGITWGVVGRLEVWLESLART